MLKRIVTLGVIFVVIAPGLFAGCGGKEKPYNAEILDDFPASVNTAFFEQTFDIKYEPESFDEWWSDENDGWWNYNFDGKTLVHKQSLIIKELSEANAAFDDFPLDFDFENEMLIICFFAQTSQWIKSPSSYEIDKVSIDGSTLKFNIRISAQRSSAQGRSNQENKVIKLEKIDIANVQFELIYVA